MISREGTHSPLRQRASQAGFVAGYFREHMLMTAGEIQQARGRLVSTARSRGLNVDAIFIERLESAPDAFAAMVEKLQTPGPNVLLIPGLHHLAGLGNHPMTVLEALRCDGVEVVFAPHVE